MLKTLFHGRLVCWFLAEISRSFYLRCRLSLKEETNKENSNRNGRWETGVEIERRILYEYSRWNLCNFWLSDLRIDSCFNELAKLLDLNTERFMTEEISRKFCRMMKHKCNNVFCRLLRYSHININIFLYYKIIHRTKYVEPSIENHLNLRTIEFHFFTPQVLQLIQALEA